MKGRPVRETVLVVDDEAGVRASLAGILGDEGYAGRRGGLAARRRSPRSSRAATTSSCSTCGCRGRTGSRCWRAIREIGRRAAGGRDLRATARSRPRSRRSGSGAQDFVEKPLSLEKTLLAVRNALQRRRLETEVRALKQQLDERYVMVGESPALRRLRAEIAQAAPTQRPRPHLRRERHRQGAGGARDPRPAACARPGPFVEVNCAAIPEELIESELFGHVKGAFTGALAARKGKFELADGGTLFLDEIGDMSLKTQAKVLRALQEQRIEPVGGAGSVEVDVRVIAATNKNLEEEIRQGRFREDLYFRLNVIPFHVPPLRERREDIPLLAAALHGRALRRARPQARARSPRRRSPRSRSCPGRATCASCATSSSGW